MLNSVITTVENDENTPKPTFILSREEKEQEILSAGEALQRQGIRLLERQAGDRDSFSEVTFELSERLQALYGVLRGLSELYKSPVAYIKSNHTARNFTLYFKAEAKQEVKSFLEFVFNVLEKEIHFKKILHKIISIQNRQQRENELIYKQLF